MVTEPTHEEIPEDSHTPATKADLRNVESSLRTEIEGVDERLIGVERQLRDIKETMGTKDQVANVLEIIQSIDQRLKEWGDVGSRLDQLEEEVAELTLKR